MAWMRQLEVVLIESWLDKNTDVHKPDFGRRGWSVSNARDRGRVAEGRCRRRAMKKKKIGRYFFVPQLTA